MSVFRSFERRVQDLMAELANEEGKHREAIDHQVKLGVIDLERAALRMTACRLAAEPQKPIDNEANQ